MDTKRDKDVLRALFVKITSIRFAAQLEDKTSRSGTHSAAARLESDLNAYKKIKITSQIVKTGLTNVQQSQMQRRIIAKRKYSLMKTVAEGRGRLLKCEEFPQLASILEGFFSTEGLESHPRLSDTVLYKSKSNALTMKEARETLLSLCPKGFNIALSTCYNYTQNYKAGTAEAKRHHEGRNVNACISLHNAPRTGVAEIVVNLHWSSSNVNTVIDAAINDPDDTLVDSKDAKNIACADIAPVQKPSKTWKKRDGITPDHSWDQSRVNAVTPMAHLFLDLHPHQGMVHGTPGIILQKMTRTGQAVIIRALNNISCNE